MPLTKEWFQDPEHKRIWNEKRKAAFAKKKLKPEEPVKAEIELTGGV